MVELKFTIIRKNLRKYLKKIIYRFMYFFFWEVVMNQHRNEYIKN